MDFKNIKICGNSPVASYQRLTELRLEVLNLIDIRI